MTLGKRIEKSRPTPIGHKSPENKTKEQLNESSRPHSDKKMIERQPRKLLL